MWQKIILYCLIVTNVGGNRTGIYDIKEDFTERLKSDAVSLNIYMNLVK